MKATFQGRLCLIKCGSSEERIITSSNYYDLMNPKRIKCMKLTNIHLFPQKMKSVYTFLADVDKTTVICGLGYIHQRDLLRKAPLF